MTPAQELRIIIQSLLDWQSKHLTPGYDNDLQMDGILAQLDEFEENLTAGIKDE